MKLFHVTEKRHLELIRKEGLRSGTYFSIDPDLVDYYAGTIEDENQSPVVLQVSLEDLDAKFMEPDYPGIEEPITTVLGESERFIQQEWKHSDQSWQDSLELVKSVKYAAVIAPEHLLIVDDDGATRRLDEEDGQDTMAEAPQNSLPEGPSF